jgi:hypothetical protein
MAAGLTHERDRLERRLEVGGADVLAAGGDDQFLLAVDDAQVAVVVDLADVTGVEPAVVVERLGVFRLVEVARKTLPPRQMTSPSSASASSRPGIAGPTVPGARFALRS